MATRRIVLLMKAASVALASGVFSAENICAAPVTVSDPYIYLQNASFSTLSFISAGQYLRIGANDVVPNGLSGTTAVGRTVDTVTNQTVVRPIPFVPNSAGPNFYSAIIPDNPALHGSWTLTFQNGSDIAAVPVSLPAGQQQVPFVNNVTLSGSSPNPTLAWTPPSDTQVNGYRVLVYDRGPSGTASDVIYISDLQPSQTSFTLPSSSSGGVSLVDGNRYTVEIAIIQTYDNSSTNLAISNHSARSSIYVDFTPLPEGSPAVNLPVSNPDGSFQFNMQVTAGQTYYIDPAIAVGYDYAIGLGDPNFASVILPSLQDAPYHLSFFDDGQFFEFDLAGNVQYFFPGDGVEAFRVTGIDTLLALDPSNTTAFITGLTFAGGGRFTGTQTPIVTDVAETPLPSALPLFASSLGALGLAAWRRKRKG